MRLRCRLFGHDYVACGVRRYRIHFFMPSQATPGGFLVAVCSRCGYEWRYGG